MQAFDPFLVSLGARLRKARMLRGMTLQQAAGHLGLSFQQLQKYERGKNSISFQRLYALSQVYAMPMSVWLDENEPLFNDVSDLRDALSGRLLACFTQIAQRPHRRLLCDLAEALAGMPPTSPTSPEPGAS